MWLSQVLWRLLGYGEAYFKNFRDAGFDLIRSIGMTKAQLGRFYWVNLGICAFAIYYLFYEAQWLRAAETFGNPSCHPRRPLPVLATFVLAEIASFVLLVGAHTESWLLYRKQGSVADHAILVDAPSPQAVARRLHRLLWTWFPLVIALAAYLSASRFDAVVVWCDQSSVGYTVLLHRTKLICALVWPGLVAAFVLAAGVNWAIYRWRPNWRLATTLAFGLVFYALAAAIVGPSDILGVVSLCRQIPENIDWLLKQLIGG